MDWFLYNGLRHERVNLVILRLSLSINCLLPFEWKYCFNTQIINSLPLLILKTH